MEPRKFDVDRVAVIGAGPGGLAAAKYLLAEQKFSEIAIFEQRGNVGGVWNYTQNNTLDGNFTIPRTQPSATVEKPTWEDDEAIFVSPVYDYLETNIPNNLMNYSDLPFPKGSSLFPKHAVVKKYLETYAEELKPYLHLSTQVLDVRRVCSSSKGIWTVKTLNLKTQTESIAEFDAVVVANGHYSDPFIPDISGIKEWNDSHPGVISHSKYFRKPYEFEGKKVIVVGNSASGIDLSAQISQFCQKPILISEKHASNITASTDTSQAENLPEIVEFLKDQPRAVRFANGRVETDIDKIIFCTGYFYSFPFLSSLSPALVSNGDRTQNVYKHLFYNTEPTLAFIGLPQRIVPFPVSEAQGAVIARAWSGRMTLPSLREMQKWEAATIVDRGSGRNFHTIAFPLDAEYINHLHGWALQATSRTRLANDGRGKMPPYWNEQTQWVRERFPLIKVASKKLGDRRHEICTLEELGFDYLKWRSEAANAESHLL
ncbi:thiol-specific monooxygenase [Xylona heveae TC161]|uniref:Thiol-specific monooxygenase n=1 Tax=Xylona heveae (strain CBS 132557 / TC161) TaxID=1328760 RepID=A0A165HAH2_XYLHT|nr:thiol-specific monooxygenase [Xylona heveae TC161]KZF23213.1 thiol-specific monooxygenase [Xylona heveae TC161]